MKWISVKEKLPEVCEPILIFRKNPKDIFFAEYLLPGNYPYTDHEVFLILSYPGSTRGNQEKLEVEDVTHWMPLPDPPVQNNLLVLDDPYFCDKCQKYMKANEFEFDEYRNTLIHLHCENESNG